MSRRENTTGSSYREPSANGNTRVSARWAAPDPWRVLVHCKKHTGGGRPLLTVMECPRNSRFGRVAEAGRRPGDVRALTFPSRFVANSDGRGLATPATAVSQPRRKCWNSIDAEARGAEARLGASAGTDSRDAEEGSREMRSPAAHRPSVDQDNGSSRGLHSFRVPAVYATLPAGSVKTKYPPSASGT
jgi:hypothetical protein